MRTHSREIRKKITNVKEKRFVVMELAQKPQGAVLVPVMVG